MPIRGMVRAAGGLAVILLLAPAGWGQGGAGGHTHSQAPAPAAPEEPSAPRRMTAEELHRHGGIPPGWRFALPPGDPRRGREVFAKLECYKCHAVRDEQFDASPRQAGDVGPELSGMGGHHPAEYFAESILNPNAVIVTGPGYTGPDGRSVMPDYRDSLAVSELLDLVAYLRSLTAGDPHVQGSPGVREQIAGDYRIRVDYDLAPRERRSHLMVSVTDRETGVPVPYLPVRVTIRADGQAVRRLSLSPMLGPDGLHYGADVALPARTTSLIVAVGTPSVPVMRSAAPRASKPQTVTFDWGGGHHGHGAGGQTH
jgi:hypothetical protein